MVGLFADIHANLEALRACLAHARAAGAERMVFLGDLIGYGADPQGVLDVVRAEGGRAVKGNHEAALEADAAYFNRAAREAIDWTRRALDADARGFVAALPLTAREGTAVLVHASARQPARWTYVDTPAEAQRSSAAGGATWTFSGHVHEQCLYFEGGPGRMREFQPTPRTAIPVRGPRRWLAISGSVGQPRDGSPAAAYALWDETRETLTFHRVPYDWHAAASKVRRAGLPEAIAYRMERGI